MAGQPCPGGTSYPLGPDERFRVIPFSSPRLRLARPKMSEIGKAAPFRPFAVDFETEVIGAERECSRAQIRDTASLLKKAGSASFGSGLAVDAR
jgi:hypothetical protein